MDPLLFILTAALTTFAVRVLPLLLIRRKITNRFILSFLFYVPYVTLAVMTVPAIITSTVSPWAGGAALIVGIVCALIKPNLVLVAAVCCAVVFAVESAISLLS